MGRARQPAFADLEARLGHHFKSLDFLKLALSHAGFAAPGASNERLEFLGDRVLGLVIAEALYLRADVAAEGSLSSMLSMLVNGRVCAEVADGLGVRDLMAQGFQRRSANQKITVVMLGDLMEALIAAVYLDAGLEAARGVVLRLWAQHLAAVREPRKDPKTALQEWALAKALPLPLYEIMERTGPDHEPEFRVRVQVEGYMHMDGIGASRRAAEQAAADAFQRREGAL